MERIFLKMNELNKYNVINNLILGKINKFIIKFNSQGTSTFIHNLLKSNNLCSINARIKLNL